MVRSAYAYTVVGEWLVQLLNGTIGNRDRFRIKNAAATPPL
jgi:hypothetical protein